MNITKLIIYTFDESLSLIIVSDCLKFSPQHNGWSKFSWGSFITFQRRAKYFHFVSFHVLVVGYQFHVFITMMLNTLMFDGIHWLLPGCKARSKKNKNDAFLLKWSQKEKFSFDCLVEFFWIIVFISVKKILVTSSVKMTLFEQKWVIVFTLLIIRK